MSTPARVVMDDGTEITLIRREGQGDGQDWKGENRPVYYRLWQASTKWNDTAFGATEETAIAALLNRLHAPGRR